MTICLSVITKRVTELLTLSMVVLLALAAPAAAREFSLEQALDQALHHTARGEMVRGNLEVARQYYSARRINMYLPEISINGSLPSYNEDQSYRGLRNSFDKELFETNNLQFRSDIELNQTLFTGGTLVATANLISDDSRYPNTSSLPGEFVDEESRKGSFSFDFKQPLFRPSASRNELNNRRDDVTIARMTSIEETAALESEVTEAYFEVLRLTLKEELTSGKLRQATLQEGIDSMKLADGILSNEQMLLSSSTRLDAELEHFEVRTRLDEQQRELATLLDLNVTEQLELSMPEVAAPLQRSERERMESAWEMTVPITKARHEYEKSKRAANYAASGHGLTGDLNANYNFGRQEIQTDLAGTVTEDNVKTNGWTISLDFRLPLWDGGAGGAAVRAAKYEAERARYEFTRAERSARVQIVNLLNQLDVSHQRLTIINKQIELAGGRLEIARSRYSDGQISELTLITSNVFYLETKERYLQEFMAYRLRRIELDAKFASE